MIQRAPGLGVGRLVVSRVAGASACTTVRAGDPQRLLISRPRGATVWAWQSTYGGGLVAGDRIALDVELAAEARLMLATQASTKVYRSADGRPAVQELYASLAPGALLLALPDPICPFAGSRYRQEIAIACAAGASLVLLDWYSNGRAARGERWAWDDYQASLAITHAGQPLVREELALPGGPGLAARMADLAIIASVWCLGPALRPASAALLAAMRAPVDPVLPEAVSPLPDGGCVWRLAGRSVAAVQERVLGWLDGLEALAGGRPWRRRP